MVIIPSLQGAHLDETVWEQLHEFRPGVCWGGCPRGRVAVQLGLAAGGP